MPLIKPFRGLRPPNWQAEAVIAPPYDVMNEAEARQMVENRFWSFLHVSRAEVDLPPGTDPYAPEVYAKAAEKLASMRAAGIIEQDQRPYYYIYRIWMGGHVQTGLVAAASVEAYDQGHIKRHEFTRPAKEDDRVNHIKAVNAHTGPVLLAYPSEESLDELLSSVAEGFPDINAVAGDGTTHQLWGVADSAIQERISQAFEALPALYVADGHHRSAAASRVAAERKAANPEHTGEEAYNYFLTVIFPHKEMQILDYNRVVRDLNGLDKQAFLEKVGERFSIIPSGGKVKPNQRGEFGMYLDGQWYRLTLNAGLIPEDDPVKRLDASLLADNLIDPILGISDPRRDERIDFVGGIRGLEGLEARVDSGEMQVAFALYPTAMEDLMAVADAGEVMPPKSTWFEPKLVDGLVSHLLD
jgi:uncharacterized protein (DUF1015 family)